MLTRFCLILNEKKEIIAALKEGKPIPKRTQNQKEIQKQIDKLQTQTKELVTETLEDYHLDEVIPDTQLINS